MSDVPRIFFESAVWMLKAAGYVPVGWAQGECWLIRVTDPWWARRRRLAWRGEYAARGTAAIADLLPFLREEA